jgi:hypothetical protein
MHACMERSGGSGAPGLRDESHKEPVTPVLHHRCSGCGAPF